MSRKGMEAGQLVIIIVVIVSFMLIAGVVTRWLSRADDTEAERLCHDSVALRVSTALRINPQGKSDDEYFQAIKAQLTTPLLCKTIDTKARGTKNDVMKTIADKMAQCWWLFGQGKYEDLLSGSKIQVLPSLFGFDDYTNKCFNCYTILTEEINDAPEITPQEFMTFLLTEKYSKSKTTYLDYIQKSGGPGRVGYLVVNEESKEAEGILPHQAYSISMMPKLPKTDKSMFRGGTKIVGSLAGAGGAFVLGAAVSGPVGWGIIAIGAIAAQLVGTSGINDIKNALYGERDVSSIYFNTLKEAQQQCGSGDLAGE